MLIDFTVENYRSFANIQHLSMLKGSSLEKESNFFVTNANKRISLLKSVAIYGANSSGKTNLLKALNCMKEIVIRDTNINDDLVVSPFKFDKHLSESPTDFDICFFADNVRYQYGFSATSKMVVEERLYAFPKGHAQKWFARAYNKDKGEYEWRFSTFLQGTKQLWINATRENALFLSTAVKLNCLQLKPIYQWFNKLQICLTSNQMDFSNIQSYLPISKDLLNLLKIVDPSLSDIHFKSSLSEHSTSDLDNFKGNNSLKDGDGCFSKIECIHTDNDGKTLVLNCDLDESDGFKRAFYLGLKIFNALKYGGVLIVDNLDVNLHPKLVYYIVNLFHKCKTNPLNAQLIFTAHCTSILSQQLFRRDQIYFCEKDKENKTSLFSLLEFSPKKGKENIELGYLSGRYGAIPFIYE